MDDYIYAFAISTFMECQPPQPFLNPPKLSSPGVPIVVHFQKKIPDTEGIKDPTFPHYTYNSGTYDGPTWQQCFEFK